MGRASRSLAGPLGLLALGSLRPELVTAQARDLHWTKHFDLALYLGVCGRHWGGGLRYWVQARGEGHRERQHSRAGPSVEMTSAERSGVGPNDDLDLIQRHFARPSYRLCVRTARQGQVALGARLENEIHERVPVTFSPSLYNGYCLLVQRWPEVLPLKIVS
jgi:hypothetical protein